MKSIRDKLKKLDFPKKQIDVYISLFEEGETKAKKIIDKTGLHRNTVYTELDNLVEKNLVAKKKESGVYRFQALNPKRIKKEIKKKEKIADDIVEELESINKPRTQEVVVREGKEEVKQVLHEIKTSKNLKEWKTIGASEKWEEKILNKKDKDNLKAADKKYNTKRKIIASSDKQKQFESDQIKIMPGLTTKNNEIHILDDKVINTILAEPFTAIELSNEELVDSYKNFFNTLWEREVRTFHGWDEMEKMYIDVILPELEDGDVNYLIAAYPPKEKKADIASKKWDKYNEEWKKMDTRKKMLHFSKKEMERDKQRHKKAGIRDRCEYKLLPEKYHSVLSIIIWGGKYVSLTDNQKAISTLYSNQNIIKAYKNHFEMLWEIAEER
ncbi:MAG: helix-turn-helix domain-containing protein [Candidatus Magasanikbacteria bacterium]